MAYVRRKKEEKIKIFRLRHNGMDIADIGSYYGIDNVNVSCILASYRKTVRYQIIKARLKGIGIEEVAKEQGLTLEEITAIQNTPRYSENRERVQDVETQIFMEEVRSKKRKCKEHFKNMTLAQINAQAKLHNLSYGEYVAMKGAGYEQTSK